SGVIQKSSGGSPFFTTVSGMDSVHPTAHAYTSAMDFVLLASGTVKKKDNGLRVLDLGVPIPSAAPTLVASPQLTNDVSGDRNVYVLIEGTNLVVSTEDRLEWTTDVSTGRGMVQTTERIDAGDFTDGTKWHPDDLFRIQVQVGDSSKVFNLRVEFLNNEPPDSNEPVENYYYIDFPSDHSDWSIGTDVWSVLEAKRSDFIRVGAGFRVPRRGLIMANWDDIIAIRITFRTSSSSFVAFRDMKFIGGEGALTGRYQYVAVNVQEESGRYSLSPVSAKSEVIDVDNQHIKVDPVTESFVVEADETWIYRRNLDTQSPYYFIARRFNTGEFRDNLPDDDAVVGAPDLPDFDHHKANFFRIHPPDNILMMESMYYERISYMTADKLYMSEPKNVDSCDSRHVFDASGARSEKNLWVHKLPGTGLLLGTTNEIYELRGTGNIFEDGSID
ncbi:hypothetical protein LCGC14_2669560, partial [marine sediment metagenome]